MKILLGLETVGSATNRAQRQQITPDIKFTCDGMITKWIVGANWDSSDSLYPELQVWRNIGNDKYQKINGTFITIPSVSSNRIYEYDNFSPIPFQAGDILGVFLPRDRDARLRLWSENTDSPTNYYLATVNSASESPFDTINIQSTQLLISQAYHPLVSVEIGKSKPNYNVLRLVTSIFSYSQLGAVLQVMQHHCPRYVTMIARNKLIPCIHAEYVHIICMEYVCIYNLGHSIDLISHPRVKWLLSPKVVHNRMLCHRHQHHHLVVETPVAVSLPQWLLA